MARLEKKIFLDKNDDLDKAVGELVAAASDKVILNIPKSSVLGVSVHNFQVLERESETAGKELAIESVDEHILELASLATIPALNPVFKIRERAVADILPSETEAATPEDVAVPNAKRGGKEKPVKKPRIRKTKMKAEKPESAAKEKPKRAAKKKKEAEEEIIPLVVKEKEKPPVPETFEEVIPKHEFKYEEKRKEPEEKPAHRKQKRGARFWSLAVSVPVVVLGVGYFAVTDFLPKATISVSIQKTTAPFSMSVAVDKDVDAPSLGNGGIILPGQLTIAKNNLNMSFPATGSSTVSAKAAGTMTVYNDYTQNQTLVATTRFESPDGKIFRLVKQISVPKGKSADVQVIADQAGSDYNVPPAPHWNIPGLKGKPQYDKIYGETKTSMTGGASGNQVIPTQADIREGRAKIESALSDSLKSQTLILNSQNLKLLDNASAFGVTAENISSDVDKNGNFGIFAAGELRQMVFDESMLKNAILKSVATSTAETKIDDFSVAYSTSTADLANGKLAFSVSGTVTYEPKIDFDAFKKSIAGLNADALKTAVFALPGLQKANISFWPFWVNSVPTRESRVNMTAE